MRKSKLGKIQWSTLISVVYLVLACFPIIGHTANITVDGNVTYQEIEGFGFRETAGAIRNMSSGPRSQLLDLVFDKDKGIGMSIVRTTLSQGFEPSPDNYDITVQDNSAWIFNEAKQRGVTTFFASPWSPPAWMKTNNDINNGGSVKTSCYDDFAEYLAQWVKDMKSHYNIDMHAVSLQNEPDLTISYPSCRWTGQQFHDFLWDYLKPVWNAQGLSTKIMMAEEMKWTDKLVQATLNDLVTKPILDIIASHGYGTTTPFKLPNVASSNKPIWETEENGKHGTGGSTDISINDGLFWAERLHKWFTVAEINAWCWHWLICGKNWNKGWASQIIEVDGDTWSSAKRLWTIGNYSKFIRPGYYRIGCTAEPASGVFTSAYKDPNSGKFVIVAVNKNSTPQVLNVTLNTLAANSVTPYTTTDTKDLEASSDISVAGNAFTATLPAKSVTSFSGTVAGNQSPTAEFSATPSSGDVPLVVDFTDLSNDADGSIASRSWSFGDGNASTLQNPKHTYASAGKYTVTLTVTDNEGAQGVETKTNYVTAFGTREAFTQIEAESFDAQSGIQTETCSEGGENIGYIQNGDYVVYKNMDFGSGAKSFEARVASATSGGNIEIRLGSASGTLIGTCPVSGTGGWQAWAKVSCNTKNVIGVKDLYLVFTGGSGDLFNINWFIFKAENPRFTSSSIDTAKVGEPFGYKVTYQNPLGGKVNLNFGVPGNPSWLHNASPDSIAGTPAGSARVDTFRVILSVNGTAYDTLELAIHIIEPSGINQQPFTIDRQLASFNVSTRIIPSGVEFLVDKACAFTLDVYGIAGQRLWQYSRKNAGASRYAVSWRGPKPGNGVCLVVLRRGDRLFARRIAIVR